MQATQNQAPIEALFPFGLMSHFHFIEILTKDFFSCSRMYASESTCVIVVEGEFATATGLEWRVK
jgi:hypothetical protein